MRRGPLYGSLVGLAAASACASGCGGGVEVRTTSFDPACAALPELFPPAVDIAPDRGDRLLALNFGPPLVLPFDVGDERPILATDTPVLPKETATDAAPTSAVMVEVSLAIGDR